MKRTVLFGLIACVSACAKRQSRIHVSTAHMEPTISAGSTVNCDFLAYRDSNPARFDIILMDGSRIMRNVGPASKNAHLWTMRVIGMPGDVLGIGGEQILVNASRLELPASLEGIEYRGGGTWALKTPVVTLAADEYFVLGDNSTNSADSCDWGPIKRNEIIAKVLP